MKSNYPSLNKDKTVASQVLLRSASLKNMRLAHIPLSKNVQIPLSISTSNSAKC